MSSAQQHVPEMGLTDEEFEKAMSVVDFSTDALNLTALANEQVRDLNKFKKMRAEAVERKRKLESAIRALDKRISICLDALKTLQTPTNS